VCQAILAVSARLRKSIGPREEVILVAKGGVYRSAKTGRYVTKKYGQSHPATTVKESKKK
jgi:hypothetical protein